MKYSPVHRQSGFSLVELLVSLLLGSMIVAAAVELFGTNQRTFQLQQALSRVQQTGGFTMDYVARDLRKAAAMNAGGDPSAGIIYSANKGTVQPLDTGNVELSADGGGSNDDTLSFEFFGTVDCEGQTAGGASPIKIVNTYSVRASAGDRVLVCEGSVDTDTNGAILIRGIESFQVLYGVDTSQDGTAFADQYKTADNLGANDIVVSTRVAMLVRADSEGMVKQGDARQFNVLDVSLTPAEQGMRRLFTTTVKIRNLDPEAI